RLNELGKQVEKEAKRNGFTTIKNLCGHGVGKTLHDEPESIYNYHEKLDRRIIKEGMALAIETFVSERDNYVEDFGDDGWTLVTPNKCQVVQYEHSVMVTDGEPLILTVPDASFLK
ncbi:MAG: M24 family metallopeptidase, partial [Clostridia bacterium]|nr:M24 family metallopeptidase [Clostridia bacterium]